MIRILLVFSLFFIRRRHDIRKIIESNFRKSHISHFLFLRIFKNFVTRVIAMKWHEESCSKTEMSSWIAAAWQSWLIWQPQSNIQLARNSSNWHNTKHNIPSSDEKIMKKHNIINGRWMYDDEDDLDDSRCIIIHIWRQWTVRFIGGTWNVAVGPLSAMIAYFALAQRRVDTCWKRTRKLTRKWTDFLNDRLTMVMKESAGY